MTTTDQQQRPALPPIDDRVAQALAKLKAERIGSGGGMRPWMPHSEKDQPKEIDFWVVGAEFRAIENKYPKGENDPATKLTLSISVRTEENGDFWLTGGLQAKLTYQMEDYGLVRLDRWGVPGRQGWTLRDTELPDWLIGAFGKAAYWGTKEREEGEASQLYSLRFWTVDEQGDLVPVPRREKDGDMPNSSPAVRSNASSAPAPASPEAVQAIKDNLASMKDLSPDLFNEVWEGYKIAAIPPPSKMETMADVAVANAYLVKAVADWTARHAASTTDGEDDGRYDYDEEPF